MEGTVVNCTAETELLPVGRMLEYVDGIPALVEATLVRTELKVSRSEEAVLVPMVLFVVELVVDMKTELVGEVPPLVEVSADGAWDVE